MAETPEKKLGVVSLAALVVSAMIGGGIFSLPQNMAHGAAVMEVILAWGITGIGMFFIANTFRILSAARPDLSSGIYAYARLGFGRFGGFQMAWSYWLCSIFGNVGYAVLLMDALNYFFPGRFAGGNNLWSVIGGSCMIWIMNWAVLRGTRQAAFLNSIGTVFKLVPLLLFVVVMLCVFRWKVFTADMWGMENLPQEGLKPLGGVLPQVKSTMLVTLWAFIGIEGAVVVSARAKDARSVGAATLTGFLGCLAVFALLSILPFGYLPQTRLAALENPSTAPLLAEIVGGWGGDVMNLGVIIALLTSWLAFTIMIAQIPQAAALDGTFPKVFRSENRNGTPDVSLVVSSVVMQLAMIFVYFASDAWNTMLSVTGVMILPPYLACTACLWKLCVCGQYPAGMPVRRGMALFCGVAGTCYALWMIYAAGLKYLLTAFIFLVIGIPVYIRACQEQNRENRESGKPEIPYFSRYEKIGAAVICAAALLAVILFAAGAVRL